MFIIITIYNLNFSLIYRACVRDYMYVYYVCDVEGVIKSN